MSLTTVYAAIEEQLVAYVAATGAPLPSFGIGKKDLFDRRGQPTPHISWIPLGGPVSLPKAAGGDFKSNPRPLAWRQFSTMGYLWTDGIEAADQLLQHLVAALHAVSHGSYTVQREDWSVTGDLDEGNVVALTFSIGLPFVDEAQGAVTLGSAPLTRHFVTG